MQIAPSPVTNCFVALANTMLSNSVLFSISFLIGYGYITPQTTKGQMLCVFVAFIGIPITLLALKSVGELIAKLVSKVVEKFERKLLKRLEPTRKQTKSAVILFSFMVALIITSSVLTMFLKDWRLLEGVYFWFVSFSTIGFGDYVPAKSQRITQLPINNSVVNEDEDEKFRSAGKVTSAAFIGILFTFYYILGLCIVSSVLNSIMAAIEERKCRPRCPGCVSRKTSDQEDNEQNGYSEQCVAADITALNMLNYGFQKANTPSVSLNDLE